LLPLLLHQSANIKNQSNTTIAKNRCPRNDLQANKQLTEGLDNNFLLTDEIINDDTSLAITKVNNNDEDILIDIALSARNTLRTNLLPTGMKNLTMYLFSAKLLHFNQRYYKR
jgi:hypothetical protein